MNALSQIQHNPITMFRQFIALGLLLTATSAGALEIPAGKWGITSETTSPMSPQPRTQYTEECMVEGTDPFAMMNAEMAQQCKLTTTSDTDSEMQADLQCTMPGAGTMQGKITFRLDGNNSSGEMLMTMNMGGQTMQMSSKWSGERLGACD